MWFLSYASGQTNRHTDRRTDSMLIAIRRTPTGGEIIYDYVCVNLGICADWRLAVLAGVGEERLVALNAERLLVSQNVAISGQVEVAVETGEDRRVRLHDVTDQPEPPRLAADHVHLLVTSPPNITSNQLKVSKTNQRLSLSIPVCLSPKQVRWSSLLSGRNVRWPRRMLPPSESQ